MEAIYCFDWDGGRGGTLSGTFVADPSTVEKAIGQEAYFGEVLGKHSEVYGPLEAREVKEITRDPALVDAFKKILELAEQGTGFGYNPLDYVRIGACDHCGEAFGVDEVKELKEATCEKCEEVICVKWCGDQKKEHSC